MKCVATNLIFIIIYLNVIIGIPKFDYIRDRLGLDLYLDHLELHSEKMILNEDETKLNEIIKKLKIKEYEQIQKGKSLSIPFQLNKDHIEKSPLFQLIRKIPKGGLLHCHTSLIGSPDWLIKEVSYKEDLYQKINDNGDIQHKFMENCTDPNWSLMSDLRKLSKSKGEDFDKKLLHNLTLLRDDPYELPNNTDEVWIIFEKTVRAISGLMSDINIYEEYIKHILNRLIQDNVSYIEIRGAKLEMYDKKGNIYRSEEVIVRTRKIVQQFKNENKDKFFGLRFIYSPPKSYSKEELKEEAGLGWRLWKTYPDMVIGFDLVGQETINPDLEQHIDSLLFLSNKNVPFFFHAGESAHIDKTSKNNLQSAITLGTKRIGHGFALPKYPYLIDKIKEKDIAVEICPISNQMYKMTPDISTHPGGVLLWKEVPIVIASDSPTSLNTYPLSHDFYVAFMTFSGPDSDLLFLKNIIMNSIKYSGLGDKQKEDFMKFWKLKWDRFVKDALVDIQKEFNSEYNKDQVKKDEL